MYVCMHGDACIYQKAKKLGTASIDTIVLGQALGTPSGRRLTTMADSHVLYGFPKVLGHEGRMDGRRVWGEGGRGRSKIHTWVAFEQTSKLEMLSINAYKHYTALQVYRTIMSGQALRLIGAKNN